MDESRTKGMTSRSFWLLLGKMRRNKVVMASRKRGSKCVGISREQEEDMIGVEKGCGVDIDDWLDDADIDDSFLGHL